MPEKPVFNISEQLFDKLVDWQQKIEEKDSLDGEAKPEATKKTNKQINDAKES